MLSPPTSYPCWVRAIYSWSGEDKTDLGFVEGDIIEVLDTGDGNWWRGKLKRNKLVGMFPINFVEWYQKSETDKKLGPLKDGPRDDYRAPQIPDLNISTGSFGALADGRLSRGSTQTTQSSRPSHVGSLSDVSDDDDVQYALQSSQTSGNSKMSKEELLNDISNALNGHDFNTPLPPTHSKARASAGASDYSDYSNSDSEFVNSFDDTVVYNSAASGTVRGSDSRLSRTPSPLRNAMDGVLDTLDSLTMADRTKSYIPLGEAGQSHAEFQSRLKSDSEADDDDDENGFMPFGPDSYSHILNLQDNQVTRADTVHSVSTVNTSSMSVLSSDPVNLPCRTQSIRTETPVQLPTNASKQSKKSVFNKIFRSSHEKTTITEVDMFTGLKRTTSRASVKSSKSHRSLKSMSSISSLSSLKSKFKRKFSSGDLSTGNATSVVNNDYALDGASRDWIDIRRDVHRSNTITETERATRRKKIESTKGVVMFPVQTLSAASCLTYYGGENRPDPRSDDYSYVDGAIATMNVWPKMITLKSFARQKFGQQFSTPTEQLRAIYNFLSTKISWEPEIAGISAEEIQQNGINNVLQKGRASPLAKALAVYEMADALNIKCTVFRGHLKQPGDVYGAASLAVNHAWNVVLINDEWRMMDVSISSPSFPTRDTYYQSTEQGMPNYFYFLARPNEFIWTHVPEESSGQALQPPMPASECYALPLAGPAAFENNVRLLDYDTSLTRLDNYEVAELKLSVPIGTELFAQVVANKGSVKLPGLAQPFWQDSQRYYRVKGVLPNTISTGVLNIFVLQDRYRSLAYSIPIYHQGENADFQFVTRHLTPQCRRQDIYLVQPQCKILRVNNVYVFCVDQHPAKGINSGSAFSRLKIAVQSPSGKISKLTKRGSTIDGIWDGSVKVSEAGVWRGLVLADAGNAWSVFCEWTAI